MLRASMARLRNSSTSSSGFRVSWAPRLGTAVGQDPMEEPAVTPPTAQHRNAYLSLLESSMPCRDTMGGLRDISIDEGTRRDDRDMGHPLGSPRKGVRVGMGGSQGVLPQDRGGNVQHQ